MKVATFWIVWILVAASCGDLPEPGIYCLEQYGMEVRAEMRLNCPSGREVKADLDRVACVAGSPDGQAALFSGSTTLYEEEDALLGETVEGYVELEVALLHIATAGNERGVLRHEALHLAFFRLSGDPDSAHARSEWVDVN